MTPAGAPRDDLLVSVGVADAPGDAAGIARLASLARTLSARFRYWELLVAAEDEDEGRDEQLLAAVPNLRLLRMRPGSSFYQRRFAAASEAIGDVVLLTALPELEHLDLVAMVETAEAEGAVVIGQHTGTNVLGTAISALGRSAGLRIGPHDMLTIAYPRALLGIVLAHPDRQMALRFPPLDSRLPVRGQPCLRVPGQAPFRGGASSGPKLARRLSVAHRLIISSAPRVLTLLTLAALVTTIGAVLFAVYSVFIWLTLPHIEPGWFSTAFPISLTAAFLGSAIFGLSIGLQRLLEAVTADSADVVVDETSSIDLFGKVMHEFNVEVQSSRHAPLPDPAGIADDA